MADYIDANKLTEIIENHAYELTNKHNSYGVGMFVGGIFQAMDEAAADVVPTEKYNSLRNEHCLMCGKYAGAHVGLCDGCRWKAKEGDNAE